MPFHVLDRVVGEPKLTKTHPDEILRRHGFPGFFLRGVRRGIPPVFRALRATGMEAFEFLDLMRPVCSRISIRLYGTPRRDSEVATQKKLLQIKAAQDAAPGEATASLHFHFACGRAYQSGSAFHCFSDTGTREQRLRRLSVMCAMILIILVLVCERG